MAHDILVRSTDFKEIPATWLVHPWVLLTVRDFCSSHDHCHLYYIFHRILTWQAFHNLERKILRRFLDRSDFFIKRWPYTVQYIIFRIYI